MVRSIRPQSPRISSYALQSPGKNLPVFPRHHRIRLASAHRFSLVVIPALRVMLRSGSPSLIGWSLFTAMAALNVAMFVRIGHHLRRTQGVSLHGSLGPPHEMGNSGGCSARRHSRLVRAAE